MTTSPAIPAPGDREVHFPSSSARKPIKEFGYSCQAYLAWEVAKQAFRVPWVWFSRNFNPVDNVDSSNSAQIYLALSRAVQTGDVNSKIIRGYKAALLEMVSKWVPSPQKEQLENEINLAPIEWFRPQVWLLDLDGIAEHKAITVAQLLQLCEGDADTEINKTPPQRRQPDEYLFKDLKADGYAIIIDG